MLKAFAPLLSCDQCPADESGRRQDAGDGMDSDGLPQPRAREQGSAGVAPRSIQAFSRWRVFWRVNFRNARNSFVFRYAWRRGWV